MARRAQTESAGPAAACPARYWSVEPRPRKRTFFTHHLTDAVPNLHTRAPVGNPLLGPGDCRGRFYLRKATVKTPIVGRLGSLAWSSGTVARLGRRSRWNLQDLCYPIRVK